MGRSGDRSGHHSRRGNLLFRVGSRRLRGESISTAGRWKATTATIEGSLAVRRAPRDYQAELDALLSKEGPRLPSEPTNLSEDEFDPGVDPLDDLIDDAPIPAPGGIPDSVADLAPSPSASPDSPVETPADPAVGSSLATTGDLSDGDVYRLVTGNLSSDEREEFVRAYAAMTPDQRADLLDGFRNQIQGERGQ